MLFAPRTWLAEPNLLGQGNSNWNNGEKSTSFFYLVSSYCLMVNRQRWMTLSSDKYSETTKWFMIFNHSFPSQPFTHIIFEALGITIVITVRFPKRSLAVGTKLATFLKIFSNCKLAVLWPGHSMTKEHGHCSWRMVNVPVWVVLAVSRRQSYL